MGSSSKYGTSISWLCERSSGSISVGELTDFRVLTTHFRDRAQYQDVKTRSRKRVVPLSKVALDILRRVMAESKWTGPDDPVFAAQSNGQPINMDNLLQR